MAPDSTDDRLFEHETAVSHDDEKGPEASTDMPSSDLPAVGVVSLAGPSSVGGAVDSQPTPHFAALPFAERYTMRRVLGRGGMGEVRLCRDHTVGRDVAMKVILPRPGEAHPTTRRRFAREARVQGQLEHPAIVPVYDAGVDPAGALYFTMKRVRGLSLTQVLEALRRRDAEVSQRFSRRRLLTLFSQLCMAVHFSHQKGVLHRDLKPSNVMLGDFGEVYLLDWGLARLHDEPRADESAAIEDALPSDRTLGSGLLGTPGYMAPEQLEAPRTIDARADVYALGAILFELLCLERLHGASSISATLQTTLAVDGARPAERAEDVPPELDQLCYDATRRAPEARLASAQQLSQRIEAYLDGDRDLALRQGLAQQHAICAENALASALDGADEVDARSVAMREVSAALGLSPEHEGARATLVRLITEPPRTIPDEATEALAREQRVVYAMSARAALFFYFGYILYLPLLLWMGVRDWSLFALGWGTIAACALLTYLAMRHPPKRVTVPLVHLLVSTLTVSCVSVMFGPFVLVPMLALGNSVVYISAVGHMRGVVPLAGCLAVIAPQVLRWLDVIPDNYRFEHGAWTILPSVFHIHPLATQVFVLAAIVGTLLPACMFVGRLRESYAEAQLTLQLQAWHLRQIVPAK